MILFLYIQWVEWVQEWDSFLTASTFNGSRSGKRSGKRSGCRRGCRRGLSSFLASFAVISSLLSTVIVTVISSVASLLFTAIVISTAATLVWSCLVELQVRSDSGVDFTIIARSSLAEQSIEDVLTSCVTNFQKEPLVVAKLATGDPLNFIESVKGSTFFIQLNLVLILG
jgi:hypothetical protein